jgi:MinD-like ATPase involved in chromosome partitioning or flagellar assembly
VVTGTGGSGASTVAMGLAQGLAADARHRDMVLLADLALHADLAMLHDAQDVLPGLPELVEACRSGAADAAVDDVTFRLDDRGYHLLLGLRRHRDWTALRPRAFEAAVDAMRRRYRFVVADVDPDVEGEDETGSADVADRNYMARHTMCCADVVLVVASPTAQGMHALVRQVYALLQLGVEPTRLVAVLNQTGRSPRRRAQLARAYAELCDANASLASPLFVPASRRVDDVITRGVPLPDAWCRPLASSVHTLLDRLPAATARHGLAPEPIVPGALGSWSVASGGAA